MALCPRQFNCLALARHCSGMKCPTVCKYAYQILTRELDCLARQDSESPMPDVGTNSRTRPVIIVAAKTQLGAEVSGLLLVETIT